MKRLIYAVALVAALSLIGLALVPTSLGNRGPDFAAMRAVTVEVSTANGHGSGVLISPTLILTARHVAVNDKTWKIKFADGKTATAIVAWVSGDEGLDAAVLRLNKPQSRQFASVSCSQTTLGERVYAFGYPLEWHKTLTEGIVASDQDYSAKDEKGVLHSWKTREVTSPLVFGMSGGPVFNSAGEVVGLNDAILVMPLGFLPAPSGVNLIVPTASICETIPRI